MTRVACQLTRLLHRCGVIAVGADAISSLVNRRRAKAVSPWTMASGTFMASQDDNARGYQAKRYRLTSVGSEGSLRIVYPAHIACGDCHPRLVELESEIS